MSNTTLNQNHQVALDGLKLNTAKLMSFAQSIWTWLNPKQNRVRIEALIRELVAYYKALDREEINKCSNEIDAARAAIYEALKASAESPEEQGELIVEELKSLPRSFDWVVSERKYNHVPAYVMPAAQPVFVPQPSSISEAKPKGPTIWESCQSFFAAVRNAIKAFCSMFIPRQPEETVVITHPKPAPPPFLSRHSGSTISDAALPIQPQRDLEQDRQEHDYLRRQAEAQAMQWPVLTTRKPRGEPGVRVLPKNSWK